MKPVNKNLDRNIKIFLICIIKDIKFLNCIIEISLLRNIIKEGPQRSPSQIN